MSDLENQEKENETLAHRFHMDIFQKGDLLVADKILATNYSCGEIRNKDLTSRLYAMLGDNRNVFHF